MRSIKQKAAQTAKRAGLLTCGLLLCTVGVGFLTLAVWFQLVIYVTLTQAALILAAAYVIFGLILIAFGRSTPDNKVAPVERNQPQPSSQAPPLVQAFLYGLEAGSRAPDKDH